MLRGAKGAADVGAHLVIGLGRRWQPLLSHAYVSRSPGCAWRALCQVSEPRCLPGGRAFFAASADAVLDRSLLRMCCTLLSACMLTSGTSLAGCKLLLRCTRAAPAVLLLLLHCAPLKKDYELDALVTACQRGSVRPVTPHLYPATQHEEQRCRCESSASTCHLATGIAACQLEPHSLLIADLERQPRQRTREAATEMRGARLLARMSSSTASCPGSCSSSALSTLLLFCLSL